MVGHIMHMAQPCGKEARTASRSATILKEGAQMFSDTAIPKDAKNVMEAYELINYLYRPDVAAKNSISCPRHGNLASQKLIDQKILNDRNIYPDEAMQKKLL
jgi:putrescine transport system substrate-binding protein